MSLENIKKSICNFLRSDDASILLIHGKWGVGKTHLWTECLKDCQIELRISPRTDRPTFAKAELLVETINKISAKNKFLKVLTYPHPHPLHANIVNFPIEKSLKNTDQKKLDKGIKNTVQILLANAAITTIKQQ